MGNYIKVNRKKLDKLRHTHPFFHAKCVLALNGSFQQRGRKPNLVAFKIICNQNIAVIVNTSIARLQTTKFCNFYSDTDGHKAKKRLHLFIASTASSTCKSIPGARSAKHRIKKWKKSFSSCRNHGKMGEVNLNLPYKYGVTWTSSNENFFSFFLGEFQLWRPIVRKRLEISKKIIANSLFQVRIGLFMI